MKKLIAIIRQEDFRTFIFCFALVLLVYPFVAPSVFERLSCFFYYSFATWFFIIVIIFFALRNDDAPDKNEGDNKDTDR